MRNKILNMLKNTESYISGEEMSRELGITRAAVWKHIKHLKNEGYNILSVTNKGYCFRGKADNISTEDIKRNLTTEYIARNIHYVSAIDSTNNEAKRCSYMPDGTLIIADVQTEGKGRLGREWQSPHGTGIWMSILLKPETDPYKVSQITLIAGIAVCRAIGSSAKIKWPNDVVMNSKKLCGILTEMSAQTDRIDYVICGIGINVNTTKFPEELAEKATSLFEETKIQHNREEIAARVLNEFENLYNIFKEQGFGLILEEYRRLCITIDKDVQLIYNRKTVTGKAVDVDESGALIVETADGKISVTSGEVSVRGIYGYI